jgi:hypothetical protein
VHRHVRSQGDHGAAHDVSRQHRAYPFRSIDDAVGRGQVSTASDGGTKIDS